MATPDIKVIVYREQGDGRTLERVGSVAVPSTSTNPQADAWRKYLAQTDGGVPQGDYSLVPAAQQARKHAQEKRSTVSSDLPAPA